MSEDKSVVQKLAAPPLAPLQFKSKLASTPPNPPIIHTLIRLSPLFLAIAQLHGHINNILFELY